MREVVLTKELLQQEATGILETLHGNAAAGRENRVADLRVQVARSVTLDFDDYLLFLRKFRFVTVDRDGTAASLTAEGEQVLSGEGAAQMELDIEHHFASRLGDEVVREEPAARPPPLSPPSARTLPAPAPPAPERAAAPIRLEQYDAVTALVREPRLERPEPKAPERPASEPAPHAEPAPRALEPTVRSPEPVPRAEAARPAVPPATEAEARYGKLESLGGGALATVFRGKQNALGVEVAIKELRDIFAYFSFLQRGEVVRRLKKELCAQAALRHPGVVAVLDQACDGSRPYYVLELCPGGSLRARLDKNPGKPMPVPEALRAFLQMAYALRAAHRAGLLHQNLKPENVLFDALGNARLADFGLSRVIETEAQQKQLPQIFLGTGGMAYLPPEQLSGKKDFGPEGDVYMLGLLLYEMLAGTLPGRRSPLPSGANGAAPAKLDPIFDRMTQDRREARYPSIDALLDDFYGAFPDGRFLKKGDIVLYAEPPGPTEAEPPGKRREEGTASPTSPGLAGKERRTPVPA